VTTDDRRHEIRPDVERIARTGAPEVVYASGKSPVQTAAAVTALCDAGVAPVLVSRADEDRRAAVASAVPRAILHDDCGMVVIDPLPPHRASGRGVAIVTAGTSDLAVGRECQFVLEALGESPTVTADVGVAGLHRILEVSSELRKARVVVVVAGMEAALAPVVAGLVPAPVVAVPTSVGYGAAQDGLTALHGLLTACAPGIGVVNIDNGVGAALLAHRILGPTCSRPAP
jgi:pyridinium-3,5-biscarboxylic acid mononucleotide synthase